MNKNKARCISVESVLDQALREMPWSEQAMDLLMSTKPQHVMPEEMKERALRHLENFAECLREKVRPLTVQVHQGRAWVFLPPYSCGTDAIVLDKSTLIYLIAELQCALRTLVELKEPFGADNPPRAEKEEG